MFSILLVGLFAPLAGFLLLFLFGNRLGRSFVNITGCLSIFISFISFTALLFTYTQNDLHTLHFLLYKWIPVPGINADFSLTLDPLSLLMTLVVSGIGFLIHVYSIGYMEHDKNFARYFAFLNFFVFCMLLLVLAGNLLLLFVGWEGVGLASYLLIGFWYDRPAAAQAATKAFVVNRIGDLGFLLALLLTFHLFGTGDIDAILQKASSGFSVGAPVIALLTLLYFFGATGKSAQFPLQTWLPDAMEGPTPVSALIHAATMVTAGVYLVVRMHPLFMLAPDTLQVIGYIGAGTALYASLCAIAQTDLKRVLAYSTISQLGLMFLACSVGAFFAAIFHLTTHAFMKSLLFLSAGNVVHMTHETTNMEKMGGLKNKFPVTHILFLIGALAMSGIPPLAAFFSKDLILEEEYLAGYHFLFYVGLLVSVLTAFYLTRAYCLTFTGKTLLEEKILKSVREAPPVMLIPVAILAALSIVGGFLGFSIDHAPRFEHFLAEVDVTYHAPELSHGFHFSFATALSILGALLGVGGAAFLYSSYRGELGKAPEFFRSGFFFNEIYRVLIVAPFRALARLIANFTEPHVFDGSLRLISQGTEKVAENLQRLQNGQIRSYVGWMTIGAVLLIVYFTF
jgi:NADH-quinone oxidoreductase subunit L